MTVDISAEATTLGERAAQKAVDVLRRAVSAKGTARMMLATGASHIAFYEALLRESAPWEQIELFHLDEYIGIPATHSASFRHYLRTRFIDKINPKSANLIDVDVDIEKSVAELSAKVRQAPIDLGIIGIGENGHIAFNDPPADFETTEAYTIVRLDERCRRQQAREGWFPNLESVPTTAVSATVNLIMSSEVIISVVPYKTKAETVRDTLQSPTITNTVPATILRSHKSWFLYLDNDSASLLS